MRSAGRLRWHRSCSFWGMAYCVEFRASTLSERCNMNARMVFPLLLMGFWLFMAYRAFSHGDWTLAMVFLGTGIVLTAWRLNAART